MKLPDLPPDGLRYGSLRNHQLEALERHRAVRRRRRIAKWFRWLFGLRERWPLSVTAAGKKSASDGIR